MSEVSATAAFRVIKDDLGTIRIEGRRTWLGPQHGWTQDQTNHSVYQLLGDFAASDRDTVPQLPLLNVVSCSAKTPSGREMVTGALGNGQTVLVDWSRAKSGQLQLRFPRIKGPADIFPAPSDADLKLAVYKSSFTEYNDWVSGERVVTSFSLRLARMKSSDPACQALMSGMCGKSSPVTVRIEPVAKVNQGTIAWITNEKSISDAYTTSSKFGLPKCLRESLDALSHQGGLSFVKEENGVWNRHVTPNGGGSPMYWSRYNIAKEETEFGVVLSFRKAVELFPRSVAMDLMGKMEATQGGMIVTKYVDQMDGEDGLGAQETVRFSQTPQGLFWRPSPEGTMAEPKFSDYGKVKFKKDLSWTPEEELITVLAGLRIP